VALTSNQLQAIGSIAAAVFDLGALVVSVVSCNIARAADERLRRQESQQYANKVFLGEPPREEYTGQGARKLAPGQTIWRVVLNTSGVQIENLWVEGEDGRSVRIQGVQRCSMYALPADFVPTNLYFTDPLGGKWRRQQNGQLDDQFREMIPRDTDDSPWYDTIDGCSG
jgi:hypothetical protein